MKWERPPLTTELELGGVPLNDFLKADSPRSLNELHAAYEEFVHGFMITGEFAGQDASRWFRENVGLGEAGEWLMPDSLVEVGNTETHLHIMTLLLYVMAGSLPAGALKVGKDFITLALEGDTLGYADGALLSRYTQGFKVPLIDFSVAVTQHVKGNESVYQCRSLAMNMAYRSTLRLDEPKKSALQLALRILYWRYPYVTRLAKTLYAVKVEKDPRLEATVESIRKNLILQPDPIKYLKEELKPFPFITRPVFQELFGNPYREPKQLTSAQIKSWHANLDRLHTFQ